jgi:Zn-dependent protease with chaperone function
VIGLHLLVLAVAVAVTAPRMLAGASWVYRSPRLGIAGWYAVLLAMVTSVLGAALVFLTPWQGADAPVCVAWRWCVDAARGGHGAVGQLAGHAVIAATVLLAARMALTIAHAAREGARTRRDHVRALDLAGRACPQLGVTVLEYPQPAAYVVAGRRRRVVVTTGALQALADDELAAVLAHEQAHAAGRHDLIIDGIRLLQRAWPNWTLLARARTELGRLVEMHADDIATRAHARMSLARALVAMTATAGSAAPAAGLAPVLAATGGDALARMNRLLDPPTPLRLAHRWGIAAGLALFTLAPLGLLAAGQVIPVLGMCPTLS